MHTNHIDIGQSLDAETVHTLCQSKEVSFPLDLNASVPMAVEGYVSAASVETQEAPDVVLSPGQSLVLRCRQTSWTNKPRWSKDGQTLEQDGAAPCDSQGICLKNDRHEGWMSYVYMQSVEASQSGNYTCVGDKKKTISVRVLGFVSVILDQTEKTLSTEDASDYCIKANVSSHPLHDYCAWEDPDGNRVNCGRLSWRKR
ncbi:hypothetical protein CRUP_011074 [Coryphaenoides rupestris]|nr:hypothetical protein CRUP_011074 [Coryphaenoides rupestris]